MEFSGGARADGLLRRVLSTRDMTETFAGRLDGLLYRRVRFLAPDGLSDARHVPLKVKVPTDGGREGTQGWSFRRRWRAGVP